MELLNVLVFAYYYPPMGLSGVQRVAKFTKYLPDFGWRPHVITSGPTAYYAHDESMLKELAERDIVIYRTSGKDPNALLARKGTVKMPREFIRKFLSRISNTFLLPDNKKSWSNQALVLARELTKTIPFDVIFVSGPPFSAMMSAAKLSTETGIPLVVDYRDLWYGNQFHFYPTPWHAHKHQRYEQEVLKHASRVIVTNRRIKERLIASYTHLSFEDVVIIPHGFDPLDIPNVLDLRDRSTFKITYSGLFYDFVTPLYFFKAVKKFITANPDAKIELHFAGVLRDEYKKMARKQGVDNLLIDHGYLPHKEAVDLLMHSDALWMMVGEGRNTDTVSSGKLYEYFGTQKPLLVSVQQGALRRDAERYGAAWITDPYDVDAIAQCLAEMYERWKSDTLPAPEPTVVAQFDRRALTDVLARQLAMSTRIPS